MEVRETRQTFNFLSPTSFKESVILNLNDNTLLAAKSFWEHYTSPKFLAFNATILKECWKISVKGLLHLSAESETHLQYPSFGKSSTSSTLLLHTFPHTFSTLALIWRIDLGLVIICNGIPHNRNGQQYPRHRTVPLILTSVLRLKPHAPPHHKYLQHFHQDRNRRHLPHQTLSLLRIFR